MRLSRDSRLQRCHQHASSPSRDTTIGGACKAPNTIAACLLCERAGDKAVARSRWSKPWSFGYLLLFQKSGNRKRLRFRRRVRIGHRMRVGFRVMRPVKGVRFQDVVVQMDLAIAAIAAGCALFVEMVTAGIFRAFHADTRRFFFADTTGKWHDVLMIALDYWVLRLVFGVSAGWRESVARQRWASRSTTAYC